MKLNGGLMKVRKKPVVTDAWPVSDLLHYASKDWSKLPKPVKDAYEAGGVLFLPKSINIHTLEGIMTAELHDIIICGVKGELYPIKADIFTETYEAEP
jgi:hypothetical protein